MLKKSEQNKFERIAKEHEEYLKNSYKNMSLNEVKNIYNKFII